MRLQTRWLGVALLVFWAAFWASWGISQDTPDNPTHVLPEEMIDNGEDNADKNGNQGTDDLDAEDDARPPGNAGVGQSIQVTPDGQSAEGGSSYPDCEFESVEECDLAAQQSMAKSTRYMNYATWSGVVLTIIAVALLGGTLYYTKQAAKYTRSTVKEAGRAASAAIRANELNRRLFIAENRPWISVKMELAGPLVFDSKEASIKVRLSIKNVGKSPAEGVRRFWKFLPDEDAARRELERLSTEQRDLPPMSSDSPGDIMFPDAEASFRPTLRISKHDLDIARHGESTITPAFIGCVTYYTGEAGEPLQAVFFGALVQVNPRNRSRAGIEIPDGNGGISPSDLRIRRFFIRDSGIGIAADQAEEGGDEV